MYILMWLGILALVYVITFRDDLPKEDFHKASVFLIIITILIVVGTVLFSLFGNWSV